MKPELTTFEKLLAALADAQVDFLCVGGVACALCGFVRATEDVDIVVARDHANLVKLLAVLRTFGAGAAAELTPADFSDEEGAIRIVEDFPLDIFVRMSGKSYADLLPHRRWHEVGGLHIPYLDPTGLIELKQASWREKDRIDVVALQRLQAGKML